MILGPQGPGKVGQRGGFFVAGVAQLVEHYLAKVDVASSNLVSRSIPTPSVLTGWRGFFIFIFWSGNTDSD